MKCLDQMNLRASGTDGVWNPITYLQNLNRIFSNTSTGPVLPRMVRGCPANRE